MLRLGNWVWVFVMTVVTGNGSAVTGLGGPQGFGEIMLSRADDASLRVNVSAVFENGFQLGSQAYSGNDLFVSTNGLVSFGGAVNGVVGQLSSINRPFIAAFHADVDTRLDGEGAESGPVWVDVDPVADVVTITWQEVGFYRRNASYTNTFQLQLYDRGDDGMSIVLRYDTITWTTGDLQNGWLGLGGDPALIGWRMAASGAVNGHWASGDEGRLLDLPDMLGNTGIDGLWVYDFVPPKVITGTPADDLLSGEGGDDLLYGSTGDDRIAGLAGADAFFGGAGFDLADYSQSQTRVTVNLARPAANRGTDAAGDSYDAVEGIIGSAFGDRLTGDAADNRLEGGAGDDWLSDGAGNDTVVGGTGNDRFAAGAGADRYYGGSGTDTVDFGSATTGIRLDLATPRASTGFAAQDRFVSIEIFAGSPKADSLLGTATADRFAGMGGGDALTGRAGADSLTGGAGADTLTGGTGADHLIGGTGFDVASYASATRAVTADLATPAANLGSDAAGDQFSSIEGLHGSRHGDALWGDTRNNWLSGGGGKDRIEGRLGADTLIGGNGTDRLSGGWGRDQLQGGDGRDTASYATAEAAVTANLGRPSHNTAEAKGDRYASIEDLAGSDHGDRLTGNAGANRLYGGQGGDILQGGAGADRLDGGAGTDIASYSDARSGLHASLARPADNTGDAARDSYTGIEGLRGSRFADDLAGNGRGNLLQGGGGDDRLAGGGGNDTLDGGSGADRFFGSAGVDLASYASAGGAVYARLSDPAANLGEARGDSYALVEGLIGSAYGDTLSGSTGVDWLYGGGGADLLLGGWGDDHLSGGNGDDIFVGGAKADRIDGGTGFDFASYSNNLTGITVSLSAPSRNTDDAMGDVFVSIEGLRGSAFNDRLTGNSGANGLDGDTGDDRLDGGGGDDRLDGGDGGDTLTGGTGADLFILHATSEAGDLVTDYDPAQGDSLHITDLSIARADVSLRTLTLSGVGSAALAELQVLHAPSGQVLFTLQDGADLTDLFLRIGATSYDLL